MKMLHSAGVVWKQYLKECSKGVQSNNVIEFPLFVVYRMIGSPANCLLAGIGKLSGYFSSGFVQSVSSVSLGILCYIKLYSRMNRRVVFYTKNLAAKICVHPPSELNTSDKWLL